MNFAIRPDLRSLKRAANFLPVIVLAAAACSPEIGVATLPEKIIGCVKKERPIPAALNFEGRMQPPRHQLSVNFPSRARHIILESSGPFAQKTDDEFNVGDTVEFNLLVTVPYERNNRLSREAADLDLHTSLDRILESRVIALDETGQSNSLHKIAGGNCSIV